MVQMKHTWPPDPSRPADGQRLRRLSPERVFLVGHACGAGGKVVKLEAGGTVGFRRIVVFDPSVQQMSARTVPGPDEAVLDLTLRSGRAELGRVRHKGCR